MNSKFVVITYREEIITIGRESFIDSVVENNYGVIFEDNEETGYFYAINKGKSIKILDALHIYNVADIIDKQKPSKVKILWSEDLTKAFLSINDYYHAFFDFENKCGFCRNGFPESNKKWAKNSDRFLTDELLVNLTKVNT